MVCRSDGELPDIRTDDESNYHTRRSSLGSHSHRRSADHSHGRRSQSHSRDYRTRSLDVQWTGTQRGATDTSSYVA